MTEHVSHLNKSGEKKQHLCRAAAPFASVTFRLLNLIYVVEACVAGLRSWCFTSCQLHKGMVPFNGLYFQVFLIPLVGFSTKTELVFEIYTDIKKKKCCVFDVAPAGMII